MAWTCATCRHFAPLKPGHAAICMMRWRDLPWNAAVPLTTAEGWCEKHDPHPDFEQPADDCVSPFDVPSDPDPLREHS